MDLWIRSQDKKKLIKVNEIKIESVIDGNSFIYSDTTDLGTYKTKERALEVLDEIEGLLVLRQGLKLTADAVYSVDNGLAIYEMPKD